jgi:hypothetical protein
MLKKILIVLGTALLLLIAMLAVILIWAQRSGSVLQDRFFTAVVSGDPQQVLAMCDPALRDEIDVPVLGDWMAEVRKSLGAYKGLSKTDFDTQAKVTTEGSFKESKGTVHFERGDAASDLVVRNDLLIRFSINSDKIPDDWFHGPSDVSTYRERGETFIRRFFDPDVQAAAVLMHEALRKSLPDDKLKAMIEDVTTKSGALKSVAFETSKFSANDGQTLTMQYRLQCEQARLIADVEFRFIGLKGHLWGFDFKGDKE